jgi:hypothetical protein
MDWLKAHVVYHAGDDLEEGFCDDRSPSPSSVWTGTERQMGGTGLRATKNFAKERSWTRGPFGTSAPC